ncbi:major facilitator superfamily domain-containing protein [Cladochytrium replicatum]|nr:major facilitator superfamily domain-containing protein [Cladochytrium replicatum]
MAVESVTKLNWRSSTWLCLAVVWLGIFVDICTYSIVIPILPIIVVEQGGDARSVGILLGAYGLGTLVAAPTFGILSDRVRKRKLLMLIGLAGLLLSTLFFAMGKFLGFAAFFIARFFQGASSAVVWTLGLALVSDHYRSGEGIGAAMGIVLSGFTVGQVAGAPIGGALYSQLGFFAPFIFCGVLIGLDLIGRLLIEEPSYESSTEVDIEQVVEESSPEQLLEPKSEIEAPYEVIAPAVDTSLSIELAPVNASSTATEKTSSQPASIRSFFALFLNPHLVVLCYVTIFVSGCITAIEPTLPLFLEQNYGLDSLGVGLVFLAAVIPAGVGSPLAGWVWDLCKIKKLNGSHYVLLPATIAGIITSLSFCLFLPPEQFNLPSPAPLAALVVTVFIFGAACAFLMTPIFPEITATVPNSSVAQSYALYMIAFSLSLLLGPTVSSAVYTAWGWSWMSITIAIMFLLCIPALIWYRSPDLDKS